MNIGASLEQPLPRNRHSNKYSAREQHNHDKSNNYVNARAVAFAKLHNRDLPARSASSEIPAALFILGMAWQKAPSETVGLFFCLLADFMDTVSDRGRWNLWD
jgi:hypothetical protein